MGKTLFFRTIQMNYTARKLFLYELIHLLEGEKELVHIELLVYVLCNPSQFEEGAEKSHQHFYLQLL